MYSYVTLFFPFSGLSQRNTFGGLVLEFSIYLNIALGFVWCICELV